MVKMLITLEEKQKDTLANYSKKIEKSVAQIIREAVNEFLEKRITDVSFDDALKMTAGIWKDRKNIKNSVDFVNKLRREHTKSSIERMKRYE